MFKLGNPKNAIWEALFLTIVVFVIGLFLGIAYEGSKLDKINKYYAESEISLIDIMALNSMIDSGMINCSVSYDSSIEFADKIYREAFLLEKYEDAGKISDNIKLAHKKYDLLRTFLWMSTSKILDKCETDSYVVVYLYEYETKDLAQKATQVVWSRILFDLKQKKGNKIILIPIAVDSNLTSLNTLIGKFEIDKYPAVVISNQNIVTELGSVSDLEIYFK